MLGAKKGILYNVGSNLENYPLFNGSYVLIHCLMEVKTQLTLFSKCHIKQIILR
jgi:hypothetical protein